MTSTNDISPSPLRPPRFHPVNSRLSNLALYAPRDHPLNKPTYRYTPCVKSTESELYHPTRDSPRHARLSWQDMAPFVRVSEDGRRASVDKGFRTARANVVLTRPGRWYYECTIEAGAGIVQPGEDGASTAAAAAAAAVATGWPAHVRVGWARRQAALGAPVGYDAYGYALRDLTGDKVHQARAEPYGRPCRQGDVVGCLIELGEGAPEAAREGSQAAPLRVPVLYRGQTFFETVQKERQAMADDEGGPQPASWPDSRIAYYLNGEPLGTAFQGLLAGHDRDDGYSPAVSMYGGGIVSLNFGPDFRYPPRDVTDVRSIEERYWDEVRAEDEAVRMEEEKALELQRIQGSAIKEPLVAVDELETELAEPVEPSELAANGVADVPVEVVAPEDSLPVTTSSSMAPEASLPTPTTPTPDHPDHPEPQAPTLSVANSLL